MVVHHRAIDHWIYAESWNAKTSRLLFLSSCSSSSFLLRLWADAISSSRNFLFVACTPGLSAKSRSGSIKGLKCLSNAMPIIDSTGLQSAMFLANRFAHLLDRPRDFFTLAHICHVRLRLSIDSDWSRYDIANSLNPFLYHPFVSALILSITTNLYFYCQ